MRIFITLVALLAFALHLMLGCCWHHAHGAEELSGHRHEAVGQHVHLPGCCGHQHAHHNQPEESPPADSEPSPHAPCSDPQCVYLAIAKVELPSAHEIALPLAVVDQQPAAGMLLAFIHDLTENEKFPPHLRRHLALSRLLN